MDEAFLYKLRETIEANISNPSFGASELAKGLGMSHSSLFRKLRSSTGKSINQVIREFRLNKALEILKTEDISLSELYRKIGFGSQTYFSTCFRKQFGYTPGDAMARQNDNTTVETRHFVETRHAASLHGNSPKQQSFNRFRTTIIAGSALIIIAAAVITFLAVSGSFSNKTSIAVLPFRSLMQENSDESLNEILGEVVRTSLGQIKVFDIRSAVSSRQYRDTTGKSISRIGRELRVKYIIEGSVDVQGDVLKLWIQLIPVKNDDNRWKEEYQFKIEGMEMNIEMLKIAENIAFQLNTVLEPTERAAILVRCSKSDESINNFREGRAWRKAGNFARALPYLQKAIDLDSTWPSPYLEKAYVLQNIMRSEPKKEYVEERINAIGKAHAIRPTSATYLSLASYYRDEGDYTRSLKLLKEAKKEFPDEKFIVYRMGYFCRYFGKWKEAESLLLQFQTERPEDPYVYYNLGETYEFMRDFPNAIKFYKQGISVKPDFYVNYYNLANISIKWKGDYREAREYLSQAKEEIHRLGETIPPKIFYLDYWTYLAEGRYEEAINELARLSITISESTVPPYKFVSKYLSYAMAYGYSGKPDLERAYYDSTRLYIESQIAEFPNLEKKPGLISCLGIAYAGLGDKEKALEMASLTVSLVKEVPDAFYGPFAMEDVALIYTKTGNYQEALKIIMKLLSEPGPLTARLLELDPKWEALRELPAYNKVIAKYSIDVVPLDLESFDLPLRKTEFPEVTGPTFTDQRDGHVYHYTEIGDQVWMTENLVFLPAVSPPDSLSLTNKHYYVYDYRGSDVDEAKESGNYTAYGVLYNWEAAKTACPEGWHLPSDQDWKSLEKYLGMSETEADLINLRNSGSVGLKLRPSEGWKNGKNGDNSSGFFASPAGFHHPDKNFNELGSTTAYWSSTEFGNTEALSRHMRFDFPGVNRARAFKVQGVSVRCVKE